MVSSFDQEPVCAQYHANEMWKARTGRVAEIIGTLWPLTASVILHALQCCRRCGWSGWRRPTPGPMQLLSPASSLAVW